MPEVSIVVPVYNERDNIAAYLRSLGEAVRSRAEILIVYDFDEDNTLPAIAAMGDPPAGLRLVKNTLGRGVIHALRMGLREARAPAIIVSMADGSDDLPLIDVMATRIARGADVVAASRYCRGGTQIGGPWLKGKLSQFGGRSLHALAGFPVRDATNSFRAYSRRVVQEIEVESSGGFEIGMELTVKAWARGWRVEELPATWRDRTAGESRFKLWKWLPLYLRWYRAALWHGLLRPRFPPARRQMGLGLLLAALLLGAWSAWPRAQVRLHSYDFAPQAREGQVELGWAMVRPPATLPADAPLANALDPAPDQYMTLLRTRVPGEATRARLRIPHDGSWRVWVSNARGAPRGLMLALSQAGREIPLTPLDSMHVVHKTYWSAYEAEAALTAGEYELAIRSDLGDRSGSDTSTQVGAMAVSAAATGDADTAQFGEVVLRPSESDASLPPVADAAGRLARTAALTLALLGLGLFSVWGTAPLALLTLALGSAHFVELGLSTLHFGMSDDDWYLLTDQSALLQGDYGELLRSHQGHVIPLYRALRHGLYLIADVSGTPMRIVNLAQMLLGAGLLMGLVALWTRRVLAGVAGGIIYLTALRVHAEGLFLTSCSPVAFAATAIIAAMYCLERYLRRPRAAFLAGACGAALAAPFLFAGGAIVFPALAAQYVIPLRPRLPLRRIWPMAGGLLLVMVLFLGAYRIGLGSDASSTHNLQPPRTWSALAEHVQTVIERCGEALLFGVHAQLTPRGDSAGVAAVALLLTLAPLLTRAAPRALRSTALAGLLLIALGYLVVFSIRKTTGVEWSRYHVLASVGVAVCIAAALGVSLRSRRWGRLGQAAIPLLLLVRVLMQSEELQRSESTWAHIFAQQQRVIDAMHAALRESGQAGVPDGDSSDRLVHIACSSRPSVALLSSLLERRTHHAATVAAGSPDLSNAALRRAYRELAQLHLDALSPPNNDLGTVLVADSTDELPAVPLLRVDAAGVEAFARFAAQNKLERRAATWFTWLPRESRLHVWVNQPARLCLRLQVAGHFTWRLVAALGAQRVEQPLGALREIALDFALPAGQSDLLLEIVDSEAPPKPATTPAAGATAGSADPRELRALCESIRLQLSPVPQPARAATPALPSSADTSDSR